MMNLLSLDDQVRISMFDEVNADIAAGKLYMCPRFNDNGRRLYPDMLRDAVKAHNDEWLSARLRSHRCFNEKEIRNTQRGIITANVPRNAPEVLAEGEFNRFYLRGLCVVALSRGIPSLVIYRARHSENPRRESEMMIGTTMDANALLNDLRINTFVDTALHLPPGPNSGLSAKLP